MTLLYLLLCAVAIVLGGTLWIRYSHRKLAAARTGEGFNEFAAHFAGEGIPLFRLREVYTYFQEWMTVHDFPVRADDDCCDVYGMCAEDLDDAANDLARTWRVKFPEQSELKHMPPVRTVGDLVRFLKRCRPQE